MNKTILPRPFTLLACLLLLLPGCSSKQQAQPRFDNITQDASPGKFGGQWWDYYERGRSFAESRSYRKAVADFQQAIAGRDKDQWQAPSDSGRTVDYFPHRELGVVHVERGEYDKAIVELAYSISSAPSAKANVFLNKARAAKIVRDGTDNAAPELYFEGSSTHEITGTCSKLVTGVVSDDSYVAAVTVGGQQVPMGASEKHKVFKTEVPLSEGENTIRAVATDLAGKTSEKNLEITCDRQGPRIEIEQLTAANNQISVSGNVTDAQTIRSLFVNGVPWPITGKAPGYNFKFSLPEGRITIIATDRAGNVTRAIIRQDEFDLRQTDNQLPDADLIDLLAPEPPLPAADKALARDTDPPNIRFEELDAQQVTYADTVLLAGQVSDDSLLVYISINGEPIQNRKGVRVYFSQLRTLQEGENTFRLVAADEFGNKGDKTIKVTRRVETIRQNGSRLRLALLPFTQNTGAAGPGNNIQDRLRQAFIAEARFNLVPGEKINAALRELHLQAGAPVTPEEAAKLGQTVGAQVVLSGQVMAGRDSIEIGTQLIDVDTATVLASYDTFGEDTGPAGTDSLFAGLASKFTRKFPLAEGVLLEVRGKEVLIDPGAQKQIKPGTRMLCYREGPPARHPVTGRPLTSEPEILGILLVTKVTKDSVKASILEMNRTFMRGDKVIAQ